ncbi:MAG: hypothetical protein R2856_26960 [Caldilineaceae bacterium]
MSINESDPRPIKTFVNGGAEREEIERRLRAYDRFQVAFRDKLMEHSIEAVAFNFGAGNFTQADHYLAYFEGTLNWLHLPGLSRVRLACPQHRRRSRRRFQRRQLPPTIVQGIRRQTGPRLQSDHDGSGPGAHVQTQRRRR